jgi:O-methyltransferase
MESEGRSKMMTVQGTRKRIEARLPKPLSRLYYRLLNPGDIVRLVAFLFKPDRQVSFYKRLHIVKRLFWISYAVDCRHSQNDIIPFIKAVFSLPRPAEGCIVEAGCFKGGSTAKFSVAARMVGRQLTVFDSFEGIPEHDEPHDKDIFGDPVSFPPGTLCGRLDEVKGNIAKFGELGVCEFVEGWFEDTMPKFSEPVAAVYLDVDLASSTRTCLKYLYPLLIPGGVFYSQDGLYPLVLDVFNDEKFWEEEIGCPRPPIEGLGKQKLIKIVKQV